jgi:predicted nucleotidyltransferase
MIKKDIKKQIMEYFFLNPSSKLRVRQIERKLNLSLPSVIRYCKDLENQNILKKITIGNVSFYTADRVAKKYLLEKTFFNIRQIIDSGLLEYLKQTLSNPVIILFGSYSRGEDIESSDIDLYIENTSKKKINLEEYEEKLKRKIQLFKYKDINKVENSHLANNILNGIVLNNQIKVKCLMI